MTKHDFRAQLAPLIQVWGAQSELERRTGISQAAISLWLSGRRGMPLERQLRLAEAMGFRVTIRVAPPKMTKPLDCRLAGQRTDLRMIESLENGNSSPNSER